MTLSCAYFLFLITASEWRVVKIYAGPDARIECMAEESRRNAGVLRKPGQIGPTWDCHASGCGE